MGKAGRGWYLAVKKTWRVMVFGGALTSRASSSPLFGDTLKATGSLSGSCWPARREGSTQSMGSSRRRPESPRPTTQVCASGPAQCRRARQPRDHLGFGDRPSMQEAQVVPIAVGEVVGRHSLPISTAQ